MAAYAYKDSYGIVPEDFVIKWCEQQDIEEDDLMEGDPMDWPQWSLLTDYIIHLKQKLQD